MIYPAAPPNRSHHHHPYSCSSLPVLISILLPLYRAEQRYHVPSPSSNSDLAEVSVGWGLCINTGYISVNMILACSQCLRGPVIVSALTLTSTLTYLPHHSLCLRLTPPSVGGFSPALLTRSSSPVNKLFLSFSSSSSSSPRSPPHSLSPGNDGAEWWR